MLVLECTLIVRSYVLFCYYRILLESSAAIGICIGVRFGFGERFSDSFR